MAGLETVYAVHNFEAENHDEIAFKVGEPIIVLEKDEEYRDGWWQGQNTKGEIGLFPMNYTSFTAPTTKSAKKSTSTQQTPSSRAQPSTMDSLQSTITQYLPSQSTQQSPKQGRERAGSLASVSSNQKGPGSVGSSQGSSKIRQKISESVMIPSLRDCPPEEWDIEQVGDWLDAMNFLQDRNTFRDQEISGDILLELTVDALKELQVNTFGKRFKMMNAINLLKEQCSTTRHSDEIDEEEEELAREEQRLEFGDEEAEDMRNTRHPTTRNDTQRSEATDRPDRHQRQHPNKMSNDIGDSRLQSDTIAEDDDVVSNYSSVTPSRPLGHSRSVHHIDRPVSPGITRSHTVASMTPSQSQNVPGQDANSRQRNVIYSPRGGNAQQSIARVWNDQPEGSSRAGAGKSTGAQTPAAMVAAPPANGVKRQGSIAPGTRPTSPPPPNGAPPFRPEHQPFEKRGSLMPQPKPQGILPVATRFSVDSQRNLNDMTPDMEGWLHKQGDKYKTWNKRWFVLKGSNLFYFKSPRDIRMKGIINLRGYRVVSDDSIMAGKWCFRAQHERERTFYFYCDTEEAMREWVKALMKATILRDYNAPVLSSSNIHTVTLETARKMRPRPPSVIFGKKNPEDKDPLASPTTRPMSPNRARSPIQAIPNGPVQPPPRNVVSPSHHPMRESAPAPQHHYLSNKSYVSEDRTKKDSGYDQVMPNNRPPIVPYFEDAEDEDLIDPAHGEVMRSNRSKKAVAAQRFIDEDEDDVLREHNPRVSLAMSGSSDNPLWAPEQYVNWVNGHLASKDKSITDLSSAFRSGDTLILLLEAISGKVVRRPAPQKGGSVSMMMLDNIVAAFKFMGREGVMVDGRYTIKDVFGGNEVKIMEMLDAIRVWADDNGYFPEESSGLDDIEPVQNELRPLSPIDEPLPSGRSTPKKVASGGTFGSENEEKLKMVGEEEGNST